MSYGYENLRLFEIRLAETGTDVSIFLCSFKKIIFDFLSECLFINFKIQYIFHFLLGFIRTRFREKSAFQRRNELLFKIFIKVFKKVLIGKLNFFQKFIKFSMRTEKLPRFRKVLKDFPRYREVLQDFFLQDS